MLKKVLHGTIDASKEPLLLREIYFSIRCSLHITLENSGIFTQQPVILGKN